RVDGRNACVRPFAWCRLSRCRLHSRAAAADRLRSSAGNSRTSDLTADIANELFCRIDERLASWRRCSPALLTINDGGRWRNYVTTSRQLGNRVHRKQLHGRPDHSGARWPAHAGGGDDVAAAVALARGADAGRGGLSPIRCDGWTLGELFLATDRCRVRT